MPPSQKKVEGESRTKATVYGLLAGILCVIISLYILFICKGNILVTGEFYSVSWLLMTNESLEKSGQQSPQSMCALPS